MSRNRFYPGARSSVFMTANPDMAPIVATSLEVLVAGYYKVFSGVSTARRHEQTQPVADRFLDIASSYFSKHDVCLQFFLQAIQLVAG